MSDQHTFVLPDLGEGLVEAEVLEWLVGLGDHVRRNQAMVEVETAKSSVEIPSPMEGAVVALHAAQGDRVPVGAALITFETTAGSGPGIVGRMSEGETTPTRGRRVRLRLPADEAGARTQ